MKKLMALFVATLMIVSVLPSVAFAEADADIQAVYDALTSEMLTSDNEPDYAVTKNLDLDLSDDLALPEGVTVSFASSLASAISDDGTVTRDASQAKSVTLTATISKDEAESLTKEFNFTILPLTSEVIASDNLYYPEHVDKALVSYSGSTAVKTVPDWTLNPLSSTIVASHFDAKFLKDSSGYYNATGTRLAGSGESYLTYAPTSVPDIIQTSDDKLVTYKIGFNPVSWGSTSTKQFYLRIYGGSQMIAYVQFWNTQTRIMYPSSANTELSKSSTAVKLNQDNSIELKMDYNKKLYYLYLNGTLINPDGTAIPDVTYTKQFSYLTFGYYREMTDSVMQINDIAITKQTPYKVKSVNDITEEIIADGQVPLFITEDLDLPANSEITWTSSNSDVISPDGIVKRPTMEDAVVTLTATDGASTKDLQFTVKALTISGVAVNNSFSDSYFDNSLKDAYCTTFTNNSLAGVKYRADSEGNYVEYNSTTTFDSSASKYIIDTGDAFPVGSLGKYIIEYDAKYSNVQHAMVTLLGNGSRTVRLNNVTGALKVGIVAGTEWYGADNKTYATVTTDSWYKFRFEIDTTKATPLVDIYMNEALIASGVEVAESSYTESLGIEFRSRDTNADNPASIKIDNLRIYTESTPDEALKVMNNQNKANYFSKFITLEAIGGSKYYDLDTNLTLNAPLQSFDLAEYGITLDWSSNNEDVVSSSGVFTRADYTRHAVLTAALTAGEGSDAVTVTKEFPFTVLADNSKEFGKASLTFDDGSVGGWVGTSNSSVQTVELPDRSGKVLEQTFTGTERGYTRSASLGGGTLKNVYSISTDVMFAPDSAATKQCFEVVGASYTSRITFNFQTGGIGVQGEFGDRYFMVPGIKAETNKWYHIDIVFNAKQKNYMPYINGQALLEEPVDVADNVWAGWLYVRNAGFYSYGTGKIYVDNFYIRESLSEAAPLDQSKDYTVRKISLYNESNNSTITNPAPDATAIIAKVKVLKNSDTQDSAGKVFFARYSPLGKLLQIVSEPLTSKSGANEVGGAIINVTMPLEGDCSNDTFKVFVIDSGTLNAYTVNTNSTGPKFDTEKLFNMDMNVTLASELGYYAESEYEGIDAIIYDGDTYLGRKTKHFAYVGLPEGASAENPVPAVVCVHGGGGSAYDEWVKRWNDKGYAAIAMNLNGRIPTPEITDGNSQLRHMWAGASQDNYGTVSPDDATWMYSAVTAVIGAHNVLREMPEVDNSKIGITGVSWGGVVTSTTIGVDNRFAFAIPFYGCGFLCESESYMGKILPISEKLWDPSNFFKDADLPVLWMNGERDANFALTSTTNSSLALGDNSYTAIVPGFGHSHGAAWLRPEGYVFADSIVKGGTALIRGEATLSGSTVTATTDRDAVKAVLRYITTDLSYTSTSNSTTLNFTFADCTTTDANTDTFTFTLPEGTKHYYVTFTDSDGNVTSTVLYDVK